MGNFYFIGSYLEACGSLFIFFFYQKKTSCINGLKKIKIYKFV